MARRKESKLEVMVPTMKMKTMKMKRKMMTVKVHYWLRTKPIQVQQVMQMMLHPHLMRMMLI